MKVLPLRIAVAFTALALASVIVVRDSSGREREPESARLRVRTDHEDCVVELDAAPAGKTDARGMLVLEEVESGSHYLHVRCPEQLEQVYFISPRAGELVEIDHKAAPKTELSPGGDSLEAAQTKIRLRELVQQAVRLRAQGHFEEAVKLLREAANLDPENSDLHRELGITFLLNKDWNPARVEMLEAIRHKADDADAHNGLGYALEKLGNIDAALKEYRIATHLEPDDTSYRQHYLEAIGKLGVKQAQKKN